MARTPESFINFCGPTARGPHRSARLSAPLQLLENDETVIKVSTSPQEHSDAEATHLVLYDGVCGLCDRAIQFLLKHDHRAVFAFASLQSPSGRAMVTRDGGNPDDVSAFRVVVNYRTASAGILSASRAVLFVAGELGWPWKAARLMRILPTTILDRVYDVVARHRYRVFGRHDQCLIPRPEYRRRFLDP